jgi:hypothetical protein
MKLIDGMWAHVLWEYYPEAMWDRFVACWDGIATVIYNRQLRGSSLPVDHRLEWGTNG